MVGALASFLALPEWKSRILKVAKYRRAAGLR
jgi:hypothetical protein